MVPLRCCVLSRIIQLWEPFKESQLTRSLESWQNLVTKLRQLLLVSFNRHLGKFEDQVRSLREKRTEPRWSFTTYFLLHVGCLPRWFNLVPLSQKYITPLECCWLCTISTSRSFNKNSLFYQEAHWNSGLF